MQGGGKEPRSWGAPGARAGLVPRGVLAPREENRVSSPVFELATTSLAFEPLTSGLVAGAKLVRRVGGMVPQYELSPAVQLGTHLTTALQVEASTLGLRVTQPAAADWVVSGSLDDLYFESRPVPFGPVLFHAYAQVSFIARSRAGEERALRYRLHNMYARYNGGFGMHDEVAEVTAQFLVESAQELASRLNRDLVGAPPHPSIASRLAALGTVAGHEAELRALGLSGAPEAPAALLALLGRQTEEADRVRVLDALASGAPREAVAPLAERYEGEDEDCRFFILKVWEAVGTDEALALVTDKGGRDPDAAVRRLAERIARR